MINARGKQVGTSRTAGAAKQSVRCNDARYETAKHLVNIAIKAHMQMFGVDRETARSWIRSAAERSDGGS